MYFSSCTAPLAITVSGALEILYDDDDDDCGVLHWHVLLSLFYKNIKHIKIDID